MRIVGDFVARRRGWVLGAWVVLAAALWLLVPGADPAASEEATYLPPDAPSRQAVEEMQKRFPALAGMSEAVVVFERPDANLTTDDLAAIERLADKIPLPEVNDPPGLDLRGIHVRSPRSIPLAENPLISQPGAHGQAAIVMVAIPTNFVTVRSTLVVRHIRAILANGKAALPAGLQAAVTGSSGYGADYAAAVERSSQRTSLVTIVAVLVILLIVYRAPLSAMIPLAAVSLAAAVVLKLLDAVSHLGLHSGTAERIFVIVLLYGAGTDYSLLLISRYRECLCEALSPRQAVAAALNATLPAILASGITNAAGLLTLCTAKFMTFRTTGPAVAMALGLMTLAALTLVPALLSFFGRAVFWPRRLAVPPVRPLDEESPAGGGESRLWRGLAVLVTARPLLVLALSLAMLAWPAVAGARNVWVHDQLTTLSPRYDAVRGMEMVKEHWGIGQLCPVTIMVQAPAPLGAAKWTALSEALTKDLQAVDDVQDVRSVSQPLGRPRREAATASWVSSIPDALREGAVRLAAQREYDSNDGLATRMLVILRSPALRAESLETVAALRKAATARVAGSLPGGQVLIGGATAEMRDVRDITTTDFHRVVFLTVGLIFVILLVLLRRAVLSLFMAACTLLSYYAVLGLARWVFVVLMGADGLDWKVEIFLFVVMVAVGVDYSIFLGARLVEETKALGGQPVSAAIRRAVVHTGPVISSCGVIMAATLGSLMTGDLALLHQLGFAMALGMLLDTFVVRPLLVPSFAALLGRKSP